MSGCVLTDETFRRKCVQLKFVNDLLCRRPASGDHTHTSHIVHQPIQRDMVIRHEATPISETHNAF